MKRSASPLAYLDEALEQARRDHLLRDRSEPVAPASSRPSFCSNDYLGLASRVASGGIAGAGASRLLGGDRSAHRALETAAAELVGMPDALVFSSGYAANVGLLSALAGPGDLIVSDALNHASIIDGARLSRARVHVNRHLDLADIERALVAPRDGRAFVVTESYFGMDADSPDLHELRGICDRHGAAMLVDEAHALGVLGPDGRGLCAAAGVAPDALMGTFGKAFGAAGAFVAGSPSLVLWCWNRARSFVFSTGLSPVLADAALAGMGLARSEPGRRQRVLAAASAFRDGLRAAGHDVRGYGPIVPWVLGEASRALDCASALRDRGVDARAVRPPTVPAGTARLRLTVTADHRAEDIEHALESIAQVSHERRS